MLRDLRFGAFLVLGALAGCGGNSSYDCSPPGGVIVIASSADWAAFAQGNCRNVAAQLKVSAPDLTSLTPPATALTSLGGLDVRANPALTTVALPALTNVDGDVTIMSNGSLARISLPSLTTVGGALDVVANGGPPILELPLLRSTGGLFAVGDLDVSPVAFPALERVGGDLVVSDNVSQTPLSVDLAALTSVAGKLWVVGPVSHLGVPALASVDWVDVKSNPSLAVLAFPSLTRVNRHVEISFNQHLTEIDAPLLAAVSGAVAVDGNDELTKLSFLALDAVGLNLEITDNRLLRQCVADAIAAQLVAPLPQITVFSNEGVPNTCP